MSKVIGALIVGCIIFLCVIGYNVFFTDSSKSIVASKRVHAFADIIEPTQLKKYKTINYVGNVIQKRNSFYDHIYEYVIRLIDVLVVFIGILVPIFILLWLVPIGLV